MTTRRDLLIQATACGTAALLPGFLRRTFAAGESAMQFGLVTYLWGRDWDLQTLIANCEAAGIAGVELRTTHDHGVEPTLSAEERKEVSRRFDDSSVTCTGIGSNERYDNPDPAVVRKAIDATKEFIRLSHDIGSTGVKVKPDRFHEGVPREQTIAQIADSLNELGEFAAGFGQQVRLEVHGQCAELPTIRQICDLADNENVALCWNSNPTDLTGDGLEANFRLVRDRFGDTLHVHALDDTEYPYQELFNLLVETEYAGWVLLEAGGEPEDRIAALKEQQALFDALVANASA